MNRTNNLSSDYRAQIYKDAGFTPEQVMRALEVIPPDLDTGVIRSGYLHKIWKKCRTFPKNKRFIRGW